MIDPAQIEHLKSRVDLATVVRARVKLRKNGKNLVGHCPFHQENTASFNVNAARGSYYCFGCKATGDVLTFLERTEGLDFRGALERLAELAGVELEPELDAKDAAERRRVRDATERMRRACAVAAEFYAAQLNTVDGGIACDEIDRRKLVDPDLAVKRFGLGYAPAEWDALARHFVQHEVSPADAEAAGLLLPSKRSGRYYDRFRHRLMFPVSDAHGRVVGFSGYRLAAPDGLGEGIAPEDAGKYVNTPDTPLYHKSSLIFGLYQAREAIAAADEAIVLEGNFDVVSMSVAGIEHVVAPLGTSFTPEHVDILRRRGSHVVLGFDADVPGDKATEAARALLHVARLPASVVTWPAKHDPDSLLREMGVEVAQECLRKAVPITGWAVEKLAYDGNRTVDRKKVLAKAAEVIADEEDDEIVLRLCGDVGRRLHYLDTQVLAAVRIARKQRVKGARANPKDAPPSAPVRSPDAPSPRSRVLPSAASEAIRMRLRAVLRTGTQGIPEDAPDALQAIAEAARDHWEEHGVMEINGIANRVTDGRLREWILKQEV